MESETMVRPVSAETVDVALRQLALFEQVSWERCGVRSSEMLGGFSALGHGVCGFCAAMPAVIEREDEGGSMCVGTVGGLLCVMLVLVVVSEKNCLLVVELVDVFD
jgi:hypothetical protein